MPRNVPKAIVSQVNAEVVRLMNVPETKSNLATKGYVVATSSPEGLATIAREDHVSWGRVIRQAKVKAE